ncbi:MAG: hypothetical protein A3J83_03795 [Elusimicrobia bacterium RIFOXYA2_FULL_40_6]|nr:MAG: hypothetical protein A3J83_03795 [Elusimicrobia bacterium RIFOXYA2_FULL_40_6]
MIYLDFYGIKLKVVSDDADLLEKLRADFSYFKSSDDSYSISVNIQKQKPLYDKIRGLKALIRKSDCAIYDKGNERFVDYLGEALAVYNYGTETGEIYSINKDLLHELAYLMILSRVGEKLDKKGVHRVHALGITCNSKTVLCLMPQGAGKTTLCLELLKYPEIKLLSDESPLISRKGQILPFPLRIGINTSLDIPGKYLYNFNRRKYGNKTLIDIEYFKDKIAVSDEASDFPVSVFIGKREASVNSIIKKAAKHKAIVPFMQHHVIGIGLPQMIEYFLRKDFQDIISKTGILFSRMYTSIKSILKSDVYVFIIGQDKQKNAQVLIEFLKK